MKLLIKRHKYDIKRKISKTLSRICIMKGFMLIISAPIGAGKTTIANAIAEFPGFVKSISATTRAPRTGEQHGVDYFFLSEEKFLEMRENDEFFECANFNGNWYGTPKEQINNMINEGKIVLLVLNIDGLNAFKKVMPDDTASIFILPPSIEELRRRSIARGDDEHTTNSRIELAKEEVKRYRFYDYTVINDDLSVCTTQIQAIINAERLKSHRR